MSIIFCPECKARVLESSSKCNECGFPFLKGFERLKNPDQGPHVMERIGVLEQGSSGLKKWNVSPGWTKAHVILSSLLFLITLFFGLFDGYFKAVSVIMMGLALVLVYWLSFFYVRLYNRLLSSNLYNNGWLRLHLVISLIGGPIIFMGHLLFEDVEEGVIFGTFLWTPFYMIFMFLSYGIVTNLKRANNWLHSINIIIALLLVKIGFDIANIYKPIPKVLLVAFIFLLYHLLFFAFCWVRKGFTTQ